ncbi:MAG TPA: NAD(P)-dependent alcohol dehydrogenase [Thermoplasmata archaeon]|nr:NAD(P)-dependent alcohol dehydrogenase [Thermoplasmata archaeon]
MRLLVRAIMGPLRPRRKVLGQEFAGDIEACGPGATRFHRGEAVFGTTGFQFGAYAEYLVLPESHGGGVIARKPTRMSYDEAATVPTGGLEALLLLRRAGGLGGRRVLVNGAGGGIGIFAVQLAKYFGAEVTGIDAPGKLELIRALGADHLIDFTRGDFADAPEKYDVVVDTVGAGTFPKGLRALRAGGCYLLANPGLSTLLRGRWPRRRRRATVIRRPNRPSPSALEFLAGLINEGRVRTVIDRRYELAQLPLAHRYVDAGLARGRVVILP